MKHLFILVVLTCLVYAAVQIMPRRERKSALRAITKHGLQLGAIVIVLVLLAVAAYYLPASTFL